MCVCVLPGSIQDSCMYIWLCRPIGTLFHSTLKAQRMRPYHEAAFVLMLQRNQARCIVWQFKGQGLRFSFTIVKTVEP